MTKKNERISVEPPVGHFKDGERPDWTWSTEPDLSSCEPSWQVVLEHMGKRVVASKVRSMDELEALLGAYINDWE